MDIFYNPNHLWSNEWFRHIKTTINACLRLSCFSGLQDELSAVHAEEERTLRDTMRKSHISNSLFMLLNFFFFSSSYSWMVMGVERWGKGFYNGVFFKVCVVIKAGNSEIKLCQNKRESICQIKAVVQWSTSEYSFDSIFHRCSPCRPVNSTSFWKC